MSFFHFSLFSCTCLLAVSPFVAGEPAVSHPTGGVSSSYSVPLAFVPNLGQADAGVDYVTDLYGQKFQIRHNGFDMVDVICPSGDYSPKPDSANVGCSKATTQTISVHLRGANSRIVSTATNLLPGKHNFLAGSKSAWRQDLPGYGRLRYKDVYPGIDLAYHAAASRPMILEYDFEMAPGADAAKIRLHFEGGVARIGTSGDLSLETGNSDPLHWLAPVAYQFIGGERKIVPAQYVAYRHNKVGFRLGSYDHSRSVVIDPALAYSQMLPGDLNLMKADPSGAVYFLENSTFVKLQADGTPGYTTTLPASMQTLFSFTVDQNGVAYFTGQTGGGLPTTPGALQTVYGGGATNAFVAKLAPSGGSFDYVTYYGAGVPGPSGNGGTSIAVDTAGNAYVAGYATGTGMPTTVGAYKTVPDNPPDANSWVAKINAAGSQLGYATFIGDLGNALPFPKIAFDSSSGSAVILASSPVPTYPVTAGAYNFPGGSTFITKVKSDGSGLTYSASFPAGSDIAVDNGGAAYLTGLGGQATPTTPGSYEPVFPGGSNNFGGTVAFVTKFDPTGSTLVYSTFLGISQSFPHLNVQAPYILVDSAGSAYIGGTSRTPGAPVVNPIQATLGDIGLPTVGDAFGAVLNPSGSNLTFETYLGGASLDILYGIGIDSSLNIYVAGNTSGNSFPFLSGSATSGGNNSFVAKITPTGGPVGVFVPPLNSYSSSFAPGTLQFGTGILGSAAAPQTIVFGNYGGAALNVSNIAVSGDFSQTNNCPTTLQPGANCQLAITFTPTAVGARSGSLTITDNAVGGSQQASFSGTGIAPAVSLSQTSLSFGSQAVGTSSAPQTITVTNSGSANLSITGIAIQGDFSQTNTCGGAILPQASCTIAVTFTPTTSGPRAGSLGLTDNAPGSPQQVALAGNTDFSISAASGSSPSATVAAGQTASYTLSVTPSVGFSGTVALSCTGAPAGASCSIPASTQLNSPTPATVNVSVSTTSRTTGLLRSSSRPSPWLWAAASIGFVGLLLIGKPPNRMLSSTVCVLWVAMLVSLSACGGNSGGPKPNPGGTPAGSYTLTVTATSNATSHSVPLMLTVQ